MPGLKTSLQSLVSLPSSLARAGAPTQGGGVTVVIDGITAQRFVDDKTLSFITDDASGSRIYSEIK